MDALEVGEVATGIQGWCGFLQDDMADATVRTVDEVNPYFGGVHRLPCRQYICSVIPDKLLRIGRYGSCGLTEVGESTQSEQEVTDSIL